MRSEASREIKKKLNEVNHNHNHNVYRHWTIPKLIQLQTPTKWSGKWGNDLCLKEYYEWATGRPKRVVAAPSFRFEASVIYRRRTSV